jgi:hypothetical protein
VRFTPLLRQEVPFGVPNFVEVVWRTSYGQSVSPFACGRPAHMTHILSVSSRRTGEREKPVGMTCRKIGPNSKQPTVVLQAGELLSELRQMIEAARSRVATAANAELTLLYWRIGQKIHSEILSGERAAYGKAIVATVSQQLVAEYGRGFTYIALTRMAALFEAFPKEEIVATLSQQMSWSHFRKLLPLKRPLQREYYAEMCRIQRWSVRTLRERIKGRWSSTFGGSTSTSASRTSGPRLGSSSAPARNRSRSNCQRRIGGSP